MDESVSRLILLYGLGFVLAVGKACTLFIWQTLPKPRPPLRQEVSETWRRRRLRVQAAREAARAAPGATPGSVAPPQAPAEPSPAADLSQSSNGRSDTDGATNTVDDSPRERQESSEFRP